jgi:hypothetical protein
MSIEGKGGKFSQNLSEIRTYSAQTFQIAAVASIRQRLFRGALHGKVL